METSHNVKWQVSLSNGETFFEGKGDYQDIPDQKSPWQRLQAYLTEKDVTITSLSLYTDDGRTFNMPSAGKNPKFKEFAETEAPIKYEMFRKLGRDIVFGGTSKTSDKVDDLFTVAVAHYPNKQLQLWVDENNPRNCWALVKED